MTKLDAHFRGDTFRYTFALGNGYVGSDFSEMKFTLRTAITDSAVLDDTGAVAQATLTDGDIVFSGANGTVLIAASDANGWSLGVLYWDLQGVIDANSEVVTLDSGTILIKGDVTRG